MLQVREGIRRRRMLNKGGKREEGRQGEKEGKNEREKERRLRLKHEKS